MVNDDGYYMVNDGYYIYIYFWLVVYLPLWKMMGFVSWDDYSIPNCFWKVIIQSCSSHHQPDKHWKNGFPIATFDYQKVASFMIWLNIDSIGIYILHQNISKQGFEVFEANHDTMDIFRKYINYGMYDQQIIFGNTLTILVWWCQHPATTT